MSSQRVECKSSGSDGSVRQKGRQCVTPLILQNLRPFQGAYRGTTTGTYAHPDMNDTD